MNHRDRELFQGSGSILRIYNIELVQPVTDIVRIYFKARAIMLHVTCQGHIVGNSNICNNTQCIHADAY